MVPEIWSATDKMFCHSGPFFAVLPPIDSENQNFQKNGKNIEDINILKCVP